MCHADLMHHLEREWRSPARCVNAGPRPDNSWRRPESPAQWLEDDWKGPEPVRASNNPEKPLENDWGNKNFISYSQPGGGTLPPQSSASSSGSQHLYLHASEKHHKPDLLNFKKGWMSILDEPGEWKKHWFVLTDSSLRYYRDSNAEEADDLDGEIDLRSCTDVTEFAVQRNYGFQIHTKDAVFTLSAMTSGIRRNWIEALRKNVRPVSAPDVTKLSDCNKENSFRSYGSHGETNEALRKEVQSLRAQLESCRARNESLRDAARSQGESHVPQGYISQEACERSLAEMESSHQQVMEELQRHHQRELERLRQEKERLLAEEAAATAAAIEALKKAHREEMNKELGRTRSFQQGGAGAEALQKQHQLDVDSLKRELQVLSEQYSQKCLEIGQLTEKAEEQEQMLQRSQQEEKELLRQNQELQSRLSEEIGKLRSFISSRCSGDRSAQNNERSSCELEVLLRVKENELQYLKKEIQCLREELQMMQKDKRFASGKYQDVYAELNHIKVRSEREIEQLKEHLRLAMAALQEKESLCNSISK
ncbi:PREDICTED: TRIO and F-actin-binding protein [Tinamus guttatus]|uniref:TRIO and F-actin-binding protein n=1 Tax=Tinamus guttatus TaxID=94827 RepID=UPI00052EFCE3|nr:PREDICTED: TRIO and F-actin-binding protein [Tinamus guttatus]